MSTDYSARRVSGIVAVVALAGMAAALAGLSRAGGGQPSAGAAGPDREARVVVPVANGPKNGPYKVRRTDTVRIVATPVAGSTLDATVTGPADLASRKNVVHLDPDGVRTGMTRTEFEVKPTGPGKVTVAVTVKGATVPEATSTTYELVVGE